MTKDEALRLAREALAADDSKLWPSELRRNAIAAIDAALAEPDYEAPERRCGGPGCDGNCCQPAKPILVSSNGITTVKHAEDYGRACVEAAREADKALMRKALEALEWTYGGEPLPSLEKSAISALRERLGEKK